MGLTDVHRRIAVVGTTFSGKTVFLTSLINHIQEHAPSDFRLGKDIRISGFKAHDVDESWGARFPYEAYRDALVHQGQWPRKTRDTSHFVCSFSRSDWKISGSRLDFFDFPGERIADAGIAVNESFPRWSAQTLDHFQSHKPYRDLAAPYLELLQKDGVPGDDILAEYKRVLARLHLDFKPLVTPSTFLLDPEGNRPEARTEEEFMQGVNARYAGLAGREFAPIGKKQKALSEPFSKHYRKYRERVVMPVFTSLQSSHRLIVLLDIPTLLVGGVGMYNDNREILSSLFDALDPSSALGRLLMGILKIITMPLRFLFDWGGEIDRVAFVATKHDLVHPSDRDNGRLMDLLLQMTSKVTGDLRSRGVEVGHFTCSAVVSAKKAVEARSLRGRLAHDNPEKKEMTFKVSALPERWPDDWKNGDYRFYPVYPLVPANRAIAPEQDGLDRVFEYITRD